ncbi:rhamnogalacturonan lyase family protein [Rufibacter radiotolerans]|uniref:rhamnogalacturonan lyase family protein n=1 Tax=Rufibacter radiotolerans TaxID=1379910 RepID=UPI00097150D0|nr:T9SS type A sorting domain-containing protein [Rufibacter radiotolerans]
MNKPLQLHPAKGHWERLKIPQSALRCLVLVLAICLLGALDSAAQKWNILGNESQIASAASGYTSIAVLNEVPYVVFTENGAAKVKRKNVSTGTWEQVGNAIGTNLTFTRLVLDKQENLFVTYVDASNGNKLAVKTYNAETEVWEPLSGNASNLYVSTGSVNNNVSQYGSTPRSSLAFDSDNTPYIAYGDNGVLVPYVKKFDGTSWVTVGAGSVNAAAKAVGVTLVIDETDVPWLAFASLSTTTSSTGSLALYNFSGGAWTSIPVPNPIPGGSATTGATGGIRHTSMALNAAGNLAIAYFNTGNTNRATVSVYNRSTNAWSYSASLSGRDAPNLSLVRDISGNLYCSFIDNVASTSRSQARVFKQAAGATGWTELRDLAVTLGGIDEPVGNLTISAGSEAPFVVYTKTNASGISTPIVRVFTPPAAPAVLSTTGVSNITPTAASASGNISSDGGSAITERGIVYGTSPNPTTSNAKVVAGTAGTGDFTVNLSSLTPTTLYYVRAYAVNGNGTTTTYGNNVRLNTLALPDAIVTGPKQMEFLNRGVVAVRSSSAKVYVGWRLLGTEPAAIAFNVYRDGVKLNATPITSSTNFEDNTTTNGTYTVRPVLNGKEGAASEPVAVWAKNQLAIPLQIPPGGTTPDGVAYTYTANDCSVGDVDGDGEYEVFLKWDPSKLNHNSGGYSGDQIIDCYKLNGTKLWRINLGKNINAGPHFTQFMVYDFDGDGKAEIILKTADGTVDGTGNVIGDATVDYRNSGGWVQQGPEFLTVFNGLTGAAMATVPYQPARGNVSDWGDNYGNRQDRFVSAVAYLDGTRPSLIVGRGYYDKLVRAAYDWRDGQLTLRWIFDSKDPSDPANNTFSSMGNHQMTIGDVDGDGKDELINGSSAINDDGKRLWTYGFGHGDAMHMSDMDPDRPGQEIWVSLESQSQYDGNGLRLYDAKTGQTIFGVPTTGDVGRAMAADIDPAHKGYEVWGSSGNLYNVKGEQIGTNKPNYNFGIWWDGDLSRELLDKNVMDKWNPTTKSMNRLFTIYQAAPVSSNNDSKATPGLTADIMGDWREEMIFRTSDNTQLILFTTTIPTQHRIHTLMHDPQYRTAVAWQNSGYNQPPHPSFYLGNDMPAPSMPNIVLPDLEAPKVESISRKEPTAELTNAATVVYQVNFSEEVKGVDVSDFALTVTGTAAGTITSVNAASGTTLEVTVAVTGDGTLRLEVKDNTTGITDLAGNALDGGFTQGETYAFDHTAPTLTSVTLASNNAEPAFAKEGDVLTLNFTASEAITNLVVTIAGHAVQATALGNDHYTVTYTLTSSDTEGVVPFTLQFKDEVGNAGDMVRTTTNAQTITYDRSSPVFASAAVNKPTLEVPNHALEDIVVSFDIEELNGYQIGISVASNEPENGLGDGDTGPDWEIVNTNLVRLRAERSATGTGRVYTITLTAIDQAGNVSTQTLTVTVPLNQGVLASSEGKRGNGQTGLLVTAHPNPATDFFNLLVKSDLSAPITLIITDATGRVVEERTGVRANGRLSLGESYLPGVYYVQAIQGNERFVLRLMK